VTAPLPPTAFAFALSPAERQLVQRAVRDLVGREGDSRAARNVLELLADPPAVEALRELGSGSRNRGERA